MLSWRRQTNLAPLTVLDVRNQRKKILGQGGGHTLGRRRE
jgi:hypothetical protein